MTIEHHPDEELLAALRRGLARSRPACRDRDASGGMRIVPGLGAGDGARGRRADCRCEPCRARPRGAGTHAERLGEPPPPAPAPRAAAWMRRGHCRALSSAYEFGPWRRVAPRVSMRPILLPEPSSDAGLPVEGCGGSKAHRARPYRARDDLRSDGRLPPRRRALRAGRFRFRRRRCPPPARHRGRRGLRVAGGDAGGIALAAGSRPAAPALHPSLTAGQRR